MAEMTILTTSSESKETNAQELYNSLTNDCPFIAEDNEKENVNKLKRKKHLSNSLSSINGNVDEKRKKFEANARMEKSLKSKLPLPPPRNNQSSGKANAPPRLRRKLDENNLIIGKLNAQSDQLRLEITQLKSALNNEKAAVRTLRAQNEGEVRKLRGEVKKLQSYLESKKKKKPAPQPPSIPNKKESLFTEKLNQEVLLLKEANKCLEGKLNTNCSADRRKLSDLRELRDSYEIRLTHLSKSAKNEISRLLEEIKSKERNIGQLRSKINFMELNSIKTSTKNIPKNNPDKIDKGLKVTQDLIEIKKQGHITKKNIILHTTCGEKEFHSMPHETNERLIEAHNDIFHKDHQNSSDTDSALSSAPPSISPQPQSNIIESADIWQTIKTYSSDLEKLQKDYNFLLKENEVLREELNSSKKQIEQLDKTAIDASNNANKIQELYETIRFLEKKEYTLSQENHELQEQNELLEFRILELEGSHEKWSSDSSALENKEDMWCNTDKFNEDALLYTPRSDSGITSPHSHHNIDLLDHVPNEELRRRISLIHKKTNLEEEEKQCLQQVLNLLQNLDSMSNDSMSSDEPISLEIVKSRTTELDSSTQPLQTHQKIPKSCLGNNNHRIVATISPYTTTSLTSQCSSPSETPKRLRNWQTTSLSESGVFESDSFENFSQSTQTEAEDLLEIFSTSHASRDLCAEIQKLTKFREEIEESSSVPSSSLIDLQKRLQYYKERVEVLEGKLIIYESSGDLQTKRLADRLQREVQLENSVKELSDRVDILKLENSVLEEEKCEFEEAENDTRLKLQRLEVDLEILSQRNVELEISREALQQKLNETKELNLDIQQEFNRSKERVELLENESKELLEALSLLKSRKNSSELNMSRKSPQNGEGSLDPCQNDMSHLSQDDKEGKISKLQLEIHNLREREQKLICEIKKIQLHYREVMENADHHWKQLETNLTTQLAEACSNEACLKTKILQLEKRLFCDSSAAQEKISMLEESEDQLKKCLNKLTRDNRRLNDDYQALNEELTKCREEFKKTNQSDSKCLDQEKCRNKELSDEVEYLKKSLAESENAGKQELLCLKHELCRVKKELLQIEVTNAELREEVCTLESSILDWQKKCKNDAEKIRCMGDELRDRDDLCDQMERKLSRCTCGNNSKPPKNCNKMNQENFIRGEKSLAQEMEEDKCPTKKLKREEIQDLKHASMLLGQALHQVEDCPKCLPKNCEFHCVAIDVKELADSILGETPSGMSSKLECTDSGETKSEKKLCEVDEEKSEEIKKCSCCQAPKVSPVSSNLCQETEDNDNATEKAVLVLEAEQDSSQASNPPDQSNIEMKRLNVAQENEVSNQSNIEMKVLNVAQENEVSNQSNIEMKVLNAALENEVPTHDEEDEKVPADNEELTVAMAYNIQTNSPFFSIKDHFLGLKKIWNLVKSSDVPQKEDEIITTEEIPKTPLPKFKRRQSTRKLRQRHYLSPSLESRIRKILTTYKLKHADQVESESKDDFHSAQMGDFSTNPSMYSIEESKEVFDLNVRCSKSVESNGSSKLEYEITCDNNVSIDEQNICEKDNSSIESILTKPNDHNKNIEERFSLQTFTSQSNQSKDIPTDLNKFIYLIKEATRLYNENPMESDTESLFVEILRDNMYTHPNMCESLSLVCRYGFDAFNPTVASYNYDDLQKVLNFIKTVRSKCDVLKISDCPKCVPKNCEFHCVAIDVKELADSILGETPSGMNSKLECTDLGETKSEKKLCEVDEEKSEEIKKCSCCQAPKVSPVSSNLCQENEDNDNATEKAVLVLEAEQDSSQASNPPDQSNIEMKRLNVAQENEVSNQSNIEMKVLNVAQENEVSNQSNIEMKVLNAALENEVPTHDEENEKVSSDNEELTVAMAYNIQTNSPFFSIKDHFLGLKKIWNLVKSSDVPQKEDEIITTEEIPKTPLPKFKRRQSTRKLRQRHYLSPSLESRIRKILTTYKLKHADQVESESKDDFHSAQMGDFSTNPSMYSIEESKEVFDLNVRCSKSVESNGSSKLEYEITCDNNVSIDEQNICEKDNSSIESILTKPNDHNKNIEERFSLQTFTSQSNQSKDIPTDLNKFIYLIKEATRLYNENPMESDTESLFVEILRDNMYTRPNMCESLRLVCRYGFDAFNPTVASYNYDDLQKVLNFIKTVRSKCDVLKISILKKIENQIAEKLLQYQSDYVENDYCCAVYYPIRR